MTQPHALATSGLHHIYRGRAPLHFPDFTIANGETVSLLGFSGSGKTTLLLLAAGLLTAQTGAMRVCGTEPASLTGAARDRWRGRTLGIVLQSFALLPRLTVMENLLAAQFCAGLPPDQRIAEQTLATLGVAALGAEFPARLSRGQMQRAAVARAVVNKPALILADEPTSSLDDAAADAVLDVLLQVQRNIGSAVLIATHDRRVRARVDRTIALEAA